MPDAYRKRIRDLRRAAKLTQVELARAAGVTQNAISDIESGETKEPSARVFIAIARALKVTPLFLWTGHGQVDESTPTEQRAAAIARALDPDMVQHWIEVGESMLRAQRGGDTAPARTFGAPRATRKPS